MAKTKKTARPVKLNNKSASDNEIRSQLDRKTKAKKALRKAWWFIWEDDSIWSWIANIVLAFVLIKFIVYPGLGLILGTNYPIVAVVSGSMEHDGSFDDWWSSSAICSNSECSQEEWYNNKGISKSEFLEWI